MQWKMRSASATERKCEVMRKKILYIVSYDHLISKRYVAKYERVFAANAKDACRLIMDRYYEDRSAVSENLKKVRYPFHLTAKRIG